MRAHKRKCDGMGKGRSLPDPNSKQQVEHWSQKGTNPDSSSSTCESTQFDPPSGRLILMLLLWLLSAIFSDQFQNVIASFMNFQAINLVFLTWITPPPVLSLFECQKTGGSPIIFPSQSITIVFGSVHTGLEALETPIKSHFNLRGCLSKSRFLMQLQRLRKMLRKLRKSSNGYGFKRIEAICIVKNAVAWKLG